jgi:2-oxoglutarate/2-oxoacid ferredoxin oxidoreductase subunit alpha
MSHGAVPGQKRVESRESVVIRFAGDSGDGMQVTGMQFTTESALAGNDIATLPDFPAEIRAPAGTLAGVSAFQLHFSSSEVFTPGDDLDVLVAMNPAALKMNRADLKPGGILIVDREGFTEQNLKKAHYALNPLEDGSLGRYQVFQADVTKLTTAALRDLGLSARAVFRCRNFFCLGMTSWLYHRPVQPAEAWIRERFGKTPEVVEANLRALRAGHAFAENAELFAVSYEIKPATIPPGRYRNITGNTATALGFVVAARRAGRRSSSAATRSRPPATCSTSCRP